MAHRDEGDGCRGQIAPRVRHRAGRVMLGVFGLVVGLVGLGVVQAQTHQPPTREESLGIDSGLIQNQDTDWHVSWERTIEILDGRWLRLKFGQVVLAEDPVSGQRSYLRVYSIQDGAMQVLTAEALKQWRNSSAYFNGGGLRIELVAAPNGGFNRVVIDRAVVGLPDPGSLLTSICGSTDDRLPSEDVRAARGMPIGCTAWIFSDERHCMLTAGHCAGGTSVLEFNVPLSNGDGSLNHPPPEDQYSVDPESRQFVNGGIGNDWGYFGSFRNSETGLTAFEAQGDAYDLADTPPPVQGQMINITGYGTTGGGVPRQWNQAQKEHEGPYSQFTGSTVRYRTDTSGGNSGSPVVDASTGLAIGIHTHGGCSGGGGANQGTGVNNNGFRNALANPRGVCASPEGACCLDGGSCQVLSPEACEAVGGTYQGDDTECGLQCSCELVKRFKARCNDRGTIKAVLKFRNHSADGQFVKIGVDQRVFRVIVFKRKAKLIASGFSGAHTVSMVDPDCGQSVDVDCP